MLELFTLTSSIMPLKCFCNWVVLVKYGCSGFFQNDHTIWWCLTIFGKTETVRLGEAFLGHDNLTIFCSVFSFLPFLETSVTDWLLADSVGCHCFPLYEKFYMVYKWPPHHYLLTLPHSRKKQNKKEDKAIQSIQKIHNEKCQCLYTEPDFWVKSIQDSTKVNIQWGPVVFYQGKQGACPLKFKNI